MISDLVGSLPVNEQHFLSQVFPIDVNESVHHYKITIPAETVPSYVVGPRCSVFWRWRRERICRQVVKLYL